MQTLQKGNVAGLIPQLMQTILYIYPMVYRAFFGRFLLIQLSGAGDVGLLNVLLALANVIDHLSGRSVGYVPLRLMYNPRTAEAICATAEMQQTRQSMLFARLICEVSAILGSATMYTFAPISGVVGTPTSHIQLKGAQMVLVGHNHRLTHCC